MKLRIITLLFLLSFLSKGQGIFDPYFYQDILNAYLKNPAYIGIFENPDLSFVTQTETNNAYLFGIAFQQNYDNLKGAIGASYYYSYNDVTSGVSFRSHNINLQYSPCYRINRNLSVKVGAELGVIYQHDEQLGLPNQYAPDISSTYFNSMGGAVLFSKEFHLGVGFGLKGFGNSYVTAISGFPTTQVASFTLDFGVNINSHDREKTWTVTPNIFFMQNENFGMTIAGVTFHYLPLLLGMHLESDNVGNFYYIPMVGHWNKFYRVSFSYQHRTARPPKVPAFDYLELAISISLPGSSTSNPLRYSRMF